MQDFGVFACQFEVCCPATVDLEAARASVEMEVTYWVHFKFELCRFLGVLLEPALDHVRSTFYCIAQILLRADFHRQMVPVVCGLLD